MPIVLVGNPVIQVFFAPVKRENDSPFHYAGDPLVDRRMGSLRYDHLAFVPRSENGNVWHPDTSDRNTLTAESATFEALLDQQCRQLSDKQLHRYRILTCRSNCCCHT